MKELCMTDIEEETLLTGSADERREVAARLHKVAQGLADDINEPIEVRLLNKPFIRKNPSEKAFKGQYPPDPNNWI